MPKTVALVAYAGSQRASVLGLHDLLTMAAGLHPTMALEARIVEVDAPWPEEPLAAVVLPPSLGGPPDPAEGVRLRPHLQRARDGGSVLCSVCVGAFVLAEAGFLDGRTATTHWALAGDLAKAYPRVRVAAERMLVDEVDVITAGGVMAWIDLGLRLVARLLSPATALATARHLLVDPGEREQRTYVPFHPPTAHGDAPILDVQHWLHVRVGRPVSVDEAAARAGLPRRTFQRRFQRRTGVTFSDYTQRVRVARACELLEQSDHTVESIAWTVGYEDAGALRRACHKVLGLTPGEYRRRFRVR